MVIKTHLFKQICAQAPKIPQLLLVNLSNNQPVEVKAKNTQLHRSIVLRVGTMSRRPGPAGKGRTGDQTATVAQLAKLKDELQEENEELKEELDKFEKRVRQLESSMSGMYTKEDVDKLVGDLMQDGLAKVERRVQSQMVQAGPIRETASTGGYKSLEELKKETKRVADLLGT
jgi:hypothetical protein